MGKNEKTGHVAKVDEKSEIMLLSEIDFDRKWNVRSHTGASGGPEGEEQEAKGGDVAKSIAMQSAVHGSNAEPYLGQDTPIVVRKHPDPKSKKPFSCITGFTRGEAVASIANEREIKSPSIKVVVRDLDEAAALELNMRENTAREDLCGPDLAFGIARLDEFNPKRTGTDLGGSLNLSQPYVDKLRKINKVLPQKMRNQWREDTVPVPVSKVYQIACAKPEDHEALWKDAKKQQDSGAKQGNWRESNKRAASQVGAMFGQLVKAGALDELDADFFEEHLAIMVSVSKKATETDLSKFSKAAFDAYKLAKNAATETADEKAKKEKRKGNAQVSAN